MKKMPKRFKTQDSVCCPGTDREVTNMVMQRSMNTVPIRLHMRRKRMDLQVYSGSRRRVCCLYFPLVYWLYSSPTGAVSVLSQSLHESPLHSQSKLPPEPVGE
ncbi:hypothetical protein EYF80_007263 [Liparis tanakae]|uniref:Uncharacterized protein n=1 Tax=Liparis tanakae TaxID=230148 RepID=A0A4Z2IY59_9TELE|nr:hypothetical protein EYF80_007263 [Liparis tanakae]